jgi:hypothetical protein
MGWLGLSVSLVWGLAGCVNVLTPAAELVSTSSQEVRSQAWQNVERLVGLLEQVDAEKNPGIAGLVRDMKAAADAVNVPPGGNFEQLDPMALIQNNPNFWRASLELQSGDATVAALEALVFAAAGKIEHASDLLELMRAGPLMDETLDRMVAHQRSLIQGWRLNPPALDVAMNRGLPAQNRWQPTKALQASYPDSPTVAMAVLKMRAELAGIELLAEGEDERMRNKILEAEPGSMEALEAGQPMWAAVVKASGEAGDAARRISEMMTPDNIGVLNLSAKDFSTLVADFVRIGLPDWALRALQLRMGETRGADPADAEAVRKLLPLVLGEEAAAPILAAWNQGDLQAVTLFPPVDEPVARPGVPMDGLVAGHYERRRREAVAMLEVGAPSELEEQNSWLMIAESERVLGNYGLARAALDRYESLSKERVNLGRERLALATAMHDDGAVLSARESLQRIDRRMKQTHFSRGVAEVMLGNYGEAADAFALGFNNEQADLNRRAFSALHAHGVAQLAGDSREKLVKKALALVDEDEWIAKLLAAMLGEMDAEQLLAQATEGRDYLVTGQSCEAHFALAFAPGQTQTGRREHLEACVRTGMVGYIEYEIAIGWLRRVAPMDWPVPVGDAPGIRRGLAPSLESVRPQTVQ